MAVIRNNNTNKNYNNNNNNRGQVSSFQRHSSNNLVRYHHHHQHQQLQHWCYCCTPRRPITVSFIIIILIILLLLLLLLLITFHGLYVLKFSLSNNDEIMTMPIIIPQQLHPQQQQQRDKKMQLPLKVIPRTNQKNKKKKDSTNNKNNNKFCSLRTYPPRRYYYYNDSNNGSDIKKLDFLQNALYIHGQWPITLHDHDNHDNNNHDAQQERQQEQQHQHHVTTTTTSTKICVNQSEWLGPQDYTNNNNTNNTINEWPFADGTNPSIVRLNRIQPSPLQSSIITNIIMMNTNNDNNDNNNDNNNNNNNDNNNNIMYLATVGMTNSQCSWHDTMDDKRTFNISSLTKPTTVRTLLLWLNDQFQTLHQTTIFLERNVETWGNSKTTTKKKMTTTTTTKELRALDDARLFIVNNQPWISFRDGPNFGYNQQVLNPLHIVTENHVKIKASESIPFCCGRNMALMNTMNGTLQSLTWIDPVTVIDININDTSSTHGRHRRHHRRRLGKDNGKKPKSHFHGTNGFLLDYGKDELLGIGHFHRPPERSNEPTQYARHGHHYTHAFYTISKHPPYVLKRCSVEFVFGTNPEIIQFASGLEIDNVRNRLVIAYGINDCESAAMYLRMETVERMLLPVPDGQEVIDLMSKVKP